MRCWHGQHNNREGARFYAGCGSPLATLCGACGSQLPPGAAFGDHCGPPLARQSPAPASSLAPPPQMPQAYTPKHLAEKSLSSKSGLEGEHKLVTVLFADLKGSMELLADRDPEEARQLLDPVLERMMAAVHRYEGTVNQVLGDGIMALFGAPIAHEDQAVRACSAALRMQESVTRYGDDIQRSHGSSVQIRVGLNSEAVVVRGIDSSLHLDYTAVGQTTQLAARMEQMATPGSILMTPQALSVLPHLPEERDTLEQAIDPRFALRSAVQPSGDFGRILAALCEAESLAATLDDPRRLARVSVFLSGHFYRMGAHNQAIASGQRALALATAGGEVVLHALANQFLVLAYQAQGDYRRALDYFRHTVVSLDSAPRRERFGQLFLPPVFFRAWLTACHAELGMFAEGMILGEEGLRIAEVAAHPGSLAFAAWGIGLLSLRQGNLPRALPLLERAVGLCQDADLPVYFPWMAPALGAAYTLAGRLEEAHAVAERALAQVEGR